MATTLPFKAEYAKSGRAMCKMCKSPIEKAALRLAVMVQSRFHDGKDAHWFHSACFFQKHRPESVGDIEDYESLRYDDQTMIKTKLESAKSAGPSAGTSKSSKGKGAAKTGKDSNSDFLVGYAKSSRSVCIGCEEQIPKDAIRISKKDFTSERALMYGGATGLDRWYHLDCFVKIRDELQFFSAADKNTLPGFKDLDRDDQAVLKKKLPAVTASKRKLDETPSSDVPSKKVKTENGKSEKDKTEEALRKQNKELYKNRDLLETNYKKREWLQILNTNKQTVPDDCDPKFILDLAADIMTFGAMKKCTDCKSGQFAYKSGVGYQCTGYVTEFTKCGYVADGDVERVQFKVPNDLREEPVFAKRSFKVQKRVIPKHAAPVKGKVSGQDYVGPKINKKPLAGFKLAIFEIDGDEKTKLEKRIKHFGGTVASKISASVAAAITLKVKFKDTSKDVERAKKYGVPVVSIDLITNMKDVNYRLADEMSKHLLSDWVKDIRGRLKTLNQEFEKPRKEESRMEKHLSSIKLKMKDGAVIDPDSGMDDGPYHVYKEGKLIYNCVLNLTSVEEGLNSFYKLQMIESDGAPKKYYIFRAWGRIGTTIGGHQTDPHLSKQDAIDFFEEKYEEKTGNRFGSKFVKKPGKYISLDLDYGQSQENQQKLIPSLDNSQLPLPVQSLISLIFDVDIMKQTMLEFEIDMGKMPLGKMSRKQLLEAYSVLSEASKYEEQKDERKRNRLITDVSNRFYTLIPHNFGTRMPPLLDNDELLKVKIEMLDNLMEIELAYELLAKGDENGGSSIDSHYKSLNTDIDIVESQSEEFKVLAKYLANTHAPTHTNYSLKIEQAFKVARNGENKRYQKFKDLHNRCLLWHGSRISNYAGIVSQGLRIAPPEAPVTGYMFGKGIYFADMVTKSANYCYTSRENSTGLLLLCEVALGDMYELKQAKDIVKPPKEMHSVKGLGQTVPDPKEVFTFPDGVKVPYGKPTKSTSRDTALLYNEYIVYDVAQVNIKYLLRVNFNYGGRR